MSAGLAWHAGYYRDQATECQQRLDRMDPTVRERTPALVDAIERERDLWAQLADELAAHLDTTAPRSELIGSARLPFEP